MQDHAGGGMFPSMLERQEEPDELTDEEEAELMDRLREAEEHPERLIPNDAVVRARAKLAG
jgi:hypothetical protein